MLSSVFSILAIKAMRLQIIFPLDQFNFSTNIFSHAHFSFFLSREVNELFAKKAIEALLKMQHGDDSDIPIIWIHDYHLMLAASTIR